MGTSRTGVFAGLLSSSSSSSRLSMSMEPRAAITAATCGCAPAAARPRPRLLPRLPSYQLPPRAAWLLFVNARTAASSRSKRRERSGGNAAGRHWPAGNESMQNESESLRALVMQMEQRVILHVDMDAFYVMPPVCGKLCSRAACPRHAALHICYTVQSRRMHGRAKSRMHTPVAHA